MPGESPDVHDRFLLVDDAAWMLGSSLNAFGKRGALIVALPSPTELRSELTLVWQRAHPLATWLAEREKRQP